MNIKFWIYAKKNSVNFLFVCLLFDQSGGSIQKVSGKNQKVYGHYSILKFEGLTSTKKSTLFAHRNNRNNT